MTGPGPRVLVVEDDPATRRAVGAGLEGHGYAVVVAEDGEEALRAWEAGRPDLVLLDLGLPGMGGMDVIRRLRRDASTPILILSARDQERDKVEALDLGADDYVTKPFSMAELQSRVRALFRRSAGPAADQGVVEIGDLALDVARHEVRVSGQPVSLTPREFELLRVLVTHTGRLVTKGRILRAVWGAAYAEESHYVHVYISQIRRKLAAADRNGTLRGLIVAEPGIGYRVQVPKDLSKS
jgi:two-component system, OmpR family, KDP operon response regulator KdpE